MAFSFTDYTQGKPGEDRFNPLTAILQGVKQRNELAQQKAALQQAYLNQGKTQADIAQTQTNTKFAPLKEAIAAQNAQRLSTRFGQAFQLHSALSNMDPSSRNTWISQHPDEYQQMLSGLAQQNNSGVAGNAVDALVKSLYGQGQQQGQTQGQTQGQSPLQTGGQPNGQPSGIIQGIQQWIQSRQQQQQPQVQQQGQVPGQQPEIQQVQQQQQQLQQANQNVAANKANTDDLVNSLKLNANRKSVGTVANNRADSAIAFETWLNQNKAKYNQAFNTTSKYAGWKGSFQELLDKTKEKSPEDYQDLLWVRDSFIPAAVNQVKMMEKLSSSDTQRKELHSTIDALQRKDLDPASALKLFNRQIATFKDVSNSVIDAAEPIHKGIYRKLHNLPEDTGDYVTPVKKSSAATNASSTGKPLSAWSIEELQAARDKMKGGR